MAIELPDARLLSDEVLDALRLRALRARERGLTEADIADQHFGLAREIGLETVGFLMMAHTVPPEKLAEQAKADKPLAWPMDLLVCLVSLVGSLIGAIFAV